MDSQSSQDLFYTPPTSQHEIAPQSHLNLHQESHSTQNTPREPLAELHQQPAGPVIRCGYVVERDPEEDEQWDEPDPIIPLAPPPTDEYWTTVGDFDYTFAVELVKEWTGPRGYDVVIVRANKRDRDSDVFKVYLRCDRGAKYIHRIDDDYRKRKYTNTRADQCPFCAYLLRRSPFDWELKVTNPSHIHLPSEDLAAHLGLRRL
jgi:hypothetical protein